MNAYKHAFAGMDSGKIQVELSKKGKEVRVSIQDNGKGMPDDCELGKSSSLGMTIIRTLVAQLQAEMDIRSEQGTTIEIRFEEQEVSDNSKDFFSTKSWKEFV